MVIKSDTCVDRLKEAITNFFTTHTVSVELETFTGRVLGKDGDGGGGFMNKKQMKKEKKYINYTFMVLLGIFGLTAPLVMKVLGLIAAQALISAKAAMIIVGSIALKKIFEKDHQGTSVKVHKISAGHDDEYDRMGKNGYLVYNNNRFNDYSHLNGGYSTNDDYYGNNIGSSNVT
ncbi:uncharacterized protein LOC115880689 [Sitophilus oryzae]|uniref:Uncharacterized protein LOC115880689 n=1 Tax=Sitophilus oryzae TaxID=7048 RepID=A0A6J2XSM3_SITOR|nr:uncharacterized protein LOC115880689 [Sitophilus oryzae]